MEARQRVELTGTNRSCGLTYLKGKLLIPISLLHRARPGTSGSERPRLQLVCPAQVRQTPQRTLHKAALSRSSRGRLLPPPGNRRRGAEAGSQVRFPPPAGGTQGPQESGSPFVGVPDEVRGVELRTLSKVSGGDIEKATPDPIPNSEVKLLGADGTAYASRWESRTLPGLFRSSTLALRGGVDADGARLVLRPRDSGLGGEERAFRRFVFRSPRLPRLGSGHGC